MSAETEVGSDELPTDNSSLSAVLSAAQTRPAFGSPAKEAMVCKDGFCDYSKETHDAWLASMRGTGAENTTKGTATPRTPSLAGIPVATLDVSSARSNVIKRPVTAVETCEVASVSPRPAVHPDAERRRLAREARAAKRRGVSQVMAQTEWWKSSLSNVVEVASEDAFQDVLDAASSSGRIVVVDYYAPWCQACRRQFADFTSFAAANSGLLFLKVNAGNLRAMCEAQGVERLPSYAVHKPAQDVFMTGFFNKMTSNVQEAVHKKA